MIGVPAVSREEPLAPPSPSSNLGPLRAGDEVQDVAVRILEPGCPEVSDGVNVALTLDARHVVLLERDASRFQRRHFVVDVVDLPPGGGCLICSCEARLIDE